MQNLITLILILTPLFVGFSMPNTPKLTRWADASLVWLVYIILSYIGIELAQIDNFISKLDNIASQVAVLSILTIGCGLIGLMIFDKLSPSQYQKRHSSNQKQTLSIIGSLIQLMSVLFGFIIGLLLPQQYLPPHYTMTVLLMLLLLSVGIGLKGSGVSLKEVLLNKRGVQTSIIFVFSVLIGGVIYAVLMPEVSIMQGLALASGFGWYSLSAVVMTEAYGAVWGSVALFNDLIREFFALIFIPIIMRNYPSAAVGAGGATSLDFTLPIIQQSGGLQIVPMTISFGFIINVVSPILMVLFSSFG